MDRLTIAGIFIAFLAIIVGYKIEGGVIANLFNGAAFIIVFGGTLGAVMLQTSTRQFAMAIKMLKWIFIPPKYNFEQGIATIKDWSVKVRQHGYLSLEDEANNNRDPFVARGLNMLIDGVEVDAYNEAMEMTITQQKNKLIESSKLYTAMGGYSPTIGILGAVLGLIQAMNYIKQPEMLGSGIATAFIATIYGVGFANLIFIPIGNKLQQIIEEHSRYYELLAEGMYAILQGETPNGIEQKLSAFLVDTSNKSLFR